MHAAQTRIRDFDLCDLLADNRIQSSVTQLEMQQMTYGLGKKSCEIKTEKSTIDTGFTLCYKLC